jgi:ribosomal protein S6--L-glutamate ligase
MKIGILSRKATLYSTSRLIEACRQRGAEVVVLDPLQCVVKVSKKRPEVFHNGERVTGLDGVVPRIGASITVYGLAVLRQFEMMGVFPANESESIARSRDKLRSLQLLSRHEIGIPPTAFARRREDVRSAIRKVGRAPVILKLLEGTQGKGVILAESVKSAESVLDAMNSLGANILIQAFIEEAGGTDYRAIVVGGRVVAAMARHAGEGEFRSNLHRGGTATGITLKPAYELTALHAAEVLGLNIAGVDMLPSKEGPMVLEVNSSPGLEGIEGATGIDVAGAIIDFVMANAHHGHPRARGRG